MLDIHAQPPSTAASVTTGPTCPRTDRMRARSWPACVDEGHAPPLPSAPSPTRGRLQMPRRVFACLGTLATVGALVFVTALCVSSAGASPALPLNHARRWITDADGRV